MKSLNPAALASMVVALVLQLFPNESPAASTVVVFDSFGPGNSYLSSVVWGITGSSTSGGYRGQAEWFVPGVSGNLSTFTLATYRSSGSGRSNFFIAEDNGYGPGTILESYQNVYNANGLLTLTSSTQPLLQAGIKYWLCDEPYDSTTVNGWYENGINYTPGFAYERSQWSWIAFTDTAHSPPSGVFRVAVTPVPEPGLAGFAVVAGLAAIGVRRRG